MLVMQLSKLFVAVGFCATALAQGDKIKIMYLGDSITEITCWRALVWDMIAKEGLGDKVTFVGSMTSNSQRCTSTSPGFDLHHEGHSGWMAVDIANKYLTGWLQKTPADIVQFMLGTNDVRAHGLADITAAYTKMFDEMRQSNSKMKIIVDKVISFSGNTVIESINKAIPGLAQTQNKTESPIFVADCSTQAGFTSSMLRDGVHPNAAGDQVMAKQIGPVLIQAIKDKLAGK